MRPRSRPRSHRESSPQDHERLSGRVRSADAGDEAAVDLWSGSSGSFRVISKVAESAATTSFAEVAKPRTRDFGRALAHEQSGRREHPRRGRRPWPPAGHPAHPGPGRRCSDEAAPVRLPAGRATARTTAPRPDRVLADKVYSSRAIRAHLRARGVGSVIPEADEKAHRKRRGSRGRRASHLTTATATAAATSSSEHSTASNTGTGSRPHATSTPPSTAAPSAWRPPCSGSTT